MPCGRWNNRWNPRVSLRVVVCVEHCDVLRVLSGCDCDCKQCGEGEAPNRASVGPKMRLFHERILLRSVFFVRDAVQQQIQFLSCVRNVPSSTGHLPFDFPTVWLHRLPRREWHIIYRDWVPSPGSRSDVPYALIVE